MILLTGATGVLGSSLVPELLKQYPSEDIWLLIRARDGDHLAQRFSKLCAFWGIPAESSDQKRLKPICGDVTQPILGCTEEDYLRLSEGLTHIFHCAANVKMNLTEEEAHRISVVSAVGVLELAEAAQNHGVLRKVEMVSTIGIGGCYPGAIPETEFTAPRKFHNTYESSKAEAEKLAFQKIAAGLPITIHRPSMIVGDSQTGKTISFQIFYFLCEFLSGKGTKGICPDLSGLTLDTVPADFVTRAIAWSSTQTSTIGCALHLCSGEEQAIQLTELQKMVRRLWPNPPKLRSVSRPVFRRLIQIGQRLPIPGRKQLGNLDLFLEYTESKQIFTNERTLEILKQGDIHLPPPQSYLETVLKYYLASR